MKLKNTGYLALCAVSLLHSAGAVSAQENNACPVDGCAALFKSATVSGDEIALTIEANFLPDVAKNHFHIWWGENFTVQQVSANAETVSNVTQGDWHPTAEYPEYVTSSAASVSARGDATSLCISPADRNHDILDFSQVHCVPVTELLQ